ncbi:uncharacterized protein PAN0_009c3725 [Moesziomyces antarcticus]|uniref:Uncharacterized protein n=1 Tax=Pseudozyma antarctica TaxID=84753 RepID=A0A081CFR2_PSEA2|nr:uncharacterized protein PAN0_009c3725 [Moesziomyces antarcticus]GAK65508.1 hypothetical protein PAN0_009c3725 [Moesziomyces antarcticus]
MAKRDRQGARNARPPLAGGAKEHHRTQLGALAPSSDLPPLNSPSSIPSSLPSQCLCVGEAAGAQRDGRVANRAQAWHLSRLHRCQPSWEGTADFEIRALLLLLAHLPFCLEIFGPLTAGRALPLFSTARVGIWFGSSAAVESIRQAKLHLRRNGACLDGDPLSAPSADPHKAPPSRTPILPAASGLPTASATLPLRLLEQTTVDSAAQPHPDSDNQSQCGRSASRTDRAVTASAPQTTRTSRSEVRNRAAASHDGARSCGMDRPLAACFLLGDADERASNLHSQRARLHSAMQVSHARTKSPSCFAFRVPGSSTAKQLACWPAMQLRPQAAEVRRHACIASPM